MSEDPWIDALGAVARDEAELDPRLEALARGELSPREAEALRLEARTDPELARALEIFAPLAPEQVARAKSTLATRVPAAAPELAPATAAVARSRKPAWMKRTLRMASALVACALVVAVLFFWPRASLLPSYSLELAGGDRDLRSRTAPKEEVPTLSAGSRVEAILRPAYPVARDEVFVAAFARSDAGLSPLAITPEISDEGSIRVAGEIERMLPGLRGEVELLFVVGSKTGSGDLQAQARSLLEGAETPDSWQIFRRRVLLR